MDNNQKTIDEASRKAIRENINENYFVEAGAGSGKTTILVERMVKMIAEGIDISHISAITFTKAAANEFYERFQKKLIEVSLLNDVHYKQYINALQNIDLAFMGTIDSFCNMIMSEHPNEGGIPSNAKVISEEKTQELYKREYANIQNGLYDSLDSKASLFLKYDNHPEDTFILTLNELLAHRDCELVIPNYQNENLDDRFKDSIKTIRKIVKVICDNPNFIYGKQEDIDELSLLFKQYQNVFDKSWDNDISNVLLAYNKTLKNIRLLPDEIVETTLQEGIDYFVLHDSRGKWYELNPDKLPAIIKEIEDIKYAVVLDFVSSAKEQILSRLRKEGSLTYNDYLVYLRDTLKEDAANGGKLIKHIYDRHRYFLIDEFQDTDPIQAEIFFYLAADDIHPNWKDCIPHKGSLFIVGDPKQSIYRFKNADVASYLDVEAMFKEPVGEVLHLYENFRSTNVLKNWFNDTFTKLLVRSSDQTDFVSIPVDNSPCLGFTGIYKYEINSKETDDETIKNIILNLHHNKDHMIYDKKIDAERLIEWSDFMLITPTKGSLSRYTKIFRSSGIPYFVEGNIDFKDSKAFSLLVSFFGSIINRYDNRYLYSVLKSKLFGITESEIVEARNKGLVLDVLKDNTDLEVSNGLKNALELLRKYAIDALTLKSSSLLSKIIDNEKIFKKEGTENMEYVFFALELLKDRESNKEIITHDDALRFFEKLLYEKNDEERCPGLRKDGDAVHLANLHKVKGLEAPIVILAYQRRVNRNPSFRIVRDGLVNKGYLFNVSKATEKGSFNIISTSVYDETLKADEQASNDAEHLRLEYVAATRAKNVLILSDSITQKGSSKSNPWIDMIEASSLSLIGDAVKLDNSLTNYVEPIDYDDIETVNNLLYENDDALRCSSLIMKNPSKLTNDVKEYSDVEERTLKQLNENNGDNLATITGTMVHRLMELIANSRNSFNKDELIDFVVKENIIVGFDDSYFRELLNNVYDVIQNGGYKQVNGCDDDILGIILGADEVNCEVPFTYLDGDVLWNGIVDLLYKKDGKWHIIDYKTNKNDSELNSHYAEQLKAYSLAFEKSMGIEVIDALIYHIDVK